jgi:hypothetical protein
MSSASKGRAIIRDGVVEVVRDGTWKAQGSNVVIESNGVYPERTTDDPVLFVGDDDPSGAMHVGDFWMNTGAEA